MPQERKNPLAGCKGTAQKTERKEFRLKMGREGEMLIVRMNTPPGNQWASSFLEHLQHSKSKTKQNINSKTTTAVGGFLKEHLFAVWCCGISDPLTQRKKGCTDVWVRVLTGKWSWEKIGGWSLLYFGLKAKKKWEQEKYFLAALK